MIPNVKYPIPGGYKRPILKNFVMLMVVTFFSPMISAEIYKWVDEQGMTHYTQLPPPGNTEFKAIQPPPGVDGSQMKERIERQQQYVNDSVEAKKKAEEEEYYADLEKKQKESNCNLARRRLASYQRPGVSFLQADGTRVRATEEQRQAELKKSQDMIKEFCN
jgi:hypothetical protein